MVRVTVAFAVVAFGAATVIAQVPEASSQIETRELNIDLEARDYDLEARDDLDDLINVDAREPEVFFEDIDAREPDLEFFDDIEAREYEAEELNARDFEEEVLEARGPSKTVTVTVKPTPTSCTKEELKTQKEQKKINKALAVLRSAKGKKSMSRNDKQEVRRSRKYLLRVRGRRTRAAKRTARKCRTAARKADLSCKGGAKCDPTLSKSMYSAKCKSASKYLQRITASKKSRKNLDSKSKKKASKSGRKSGKLLSASKTTVGVDNITTVTINAGPTCTAGSGSSSKLRKKLTTRDIVDEEFDSVVAREYNFDDLD